MLTTGCDGRRAVAKFCKSGVWDKLPKGSTVIGIAHIVCEAGSMKRYGVRPSLSSSVSFMHGLLEVCCWGPGGQEISIDCCSSGVRRANADSATLSAYVGC